MYVAIDIGGTFTRLAQSTSIEKPNLLNRSEFSTSQNLEIDQGKIIDYLIQIKQPLSGIGIGIAGRVDRNTMILTHSNNLPHYIGQPFTKIIKTNTHAKVFMDNDGIASSLAEAYYSKHYGRNFIYITWGTGIAVFSLTFNNGKPISTKLDRPTYYSTWEEEFSGNGIYKKYGKKAELLDSQIWERIFYSFQAQLKQFVLKVNTDLVIFGGGLVSKQWNKFEPFLQKIRSDTAVQFELSSLREDIGLYGGLALLKQNKF